MINIVCVGNITSDPVCNIGKSKKDSTYATFSLAHNFKKHGNQETLFLNCVTFNENIVDLLDKYVNKGMQLACVGTLVPSEYDKKDGTHVETIQMIVHQLQLPNKK